MEIWGMGEPVHVEQESQNTFNEGGKCGDAQSPQATGWK